LLAYAVAATLLCVAGSLMAGLMAEGAAGAQADRSAGHGDRAAAAIGSVPAPHLVQVRSGPLPRARSKLVEFETAPFPYDGLVPRTNRPFLDVVENGRQQVVEGTEPGAYDTTVGFLRTVASNLGWRP